ncbi:MAG: hypothetical protein K2I22_15970 [Lachnospiraceae bacterium]|nr:hypothetical protein [Lachnospiraceae bacterium]
MSIVKRAIVLVAAVCMLVGSPAMKVSAACDHKDTGRDLQWTGQYRYSSYTHTVIRGYYTNGTPITVQCHVNVTKKIYLCYCTECGEYVTTTDLPYQEAHSIVHN